ncbi:MAG TPA: hypothetical protein VNP04_10895 [Alphaproteobacteria bacterium]|nr:hypothetical protein [Alphaproteobacteria bacterium]
MDVITQIRLLWLGGFAILYGLALGTALLLQSLQRRAEERRRRLLDNVKRQLPSRLRDQILMQVGGMALRRGAVIRLDMGEQAPEEWWPIVTRVLPQLAPEIRALVCYADTLPCPLRLSMEPQSLRHQRSCSLTAAG